MSTLQMHTKHGDSGSQSTLEVNLVRTDEKTLSLRYRFRNGDIRNAFLFNRLFRGINERGIYSVDANLVNIEMGKEGIVISKKIVPVPIEIDVEKTLTPCVMKIRPEEEFEETITVPLPLKLWTPYFNPNDTALQRAKSERPLQVWFELGLFFTPPGGERLVTTVPTTSGPALYFDPFPISGQQVMRVGPFQIKLPVHEPQP